MTSAPEERQLADRLSSYSDGVVAVTFVNALAFFVAIADQEVRCSLDHLRLLVVVLCVLLHLAYMLAIWVFRRGELRLRAAGSDSSALTELFRRRIHVGRLVFVALIALSSLAVAWWGISDVGCPR